MNGGSRNNKVEMVCGKWKKGGVCGGGWWWYYEITKYERKEAFVLLVLKKYAKPKGASVLIIYLASVLCITKQPAA